jgi:CheY-like chemotaxis protein
MIGGYNQLNESITQTISLINDVSKASQEQEKGIIQINKAVELLETKTQELTTTSPPEKTNDQAVSTENRLSNRAQELEWLRNSVSPQMADVEDVIQDVLKTIDPLLASSGVSVAHLPQENLPRLFTKVLLLQQALLKLLTIAVHYAPGGELSIWTEVLSPYLIVNIQVVRASFPHHRSPVGREYAQPEGLKMAERLISLCRGTLKTKLNAEERDVFTAMIRLPIAEQVVLVIDDNADTRRLFQRYLTGTRYRFVEAATAQHGLTLAEELLPQLIVLDVMMPEQDGWTVLGQLREHPLTHHIPVIVCSIMSQKDLSQALGAADFLRKPVSRSDLLSALDRQVDSI